MRYERVQREARESPRTRRVKGGAGFIGSRLPQERVALGQTVVPPGSVSTGNRRNLDEVRSEPGGGFRFVEDDIRDDLDTFRDPGSGRGAARRRPGSVPPRSIAKPPPRTTRT